MKNLIVCWIKDITYNLNSSKPILGNGNIIYLAIHTNFYD